MINPSSGDTSASIFAGPDASSQVLDSVPKGTMLKVTGTSGNFYTVEYDSKMPNVFHGGTEMTGTIVANPYAPMYADRQKSSIIGNVNNGTSCEILDDLHPTLIEVEAVTTEGKKSGYVEVKYIHCDNDESQTPVMFRMRATRAAKTVDELAKEVIQGKWGNGTDRKNRINAAYKSGQIPYDYSTIQNRVNEMLRGPSIPSNSGQTGIVDTGGWGDMTTRHGPDYSYPVVGSVAEGSTVTIHETKNGWHRITGTKGDGDYTDVWVPASTIKVNGTSSGGNVAKNDANEIKTSDGDDWVSAASSFSQSNLTNNVSDDYYKQLAIKYSNALGSPPKYNSNIDVRYLEVADDMNEVSSCGRVVNKTILSNPSILTICPGKAKMFPNLMGSERDTVFEAMKNAAEGNSSLKAKIQADNQGLFSGRLYKFEADTAEYAKYLNSICRACAILLGIGDETMPETETKLKHFDYAYWSIRKNYNPSSAASDVGDGSLFRNFGSRFLKTAKKVVTAAVDDTSHINFFLNGNETSISESITNSTSKSPLLSMGLETVSNVAAMINYFAGTSFDINDKSVDDALNAVIGSSDGLSGLKKLGENFVQGGRLVLPNMVDGAQYGKSISCNMRFISPYGNKLSVFLRCIVPICHIIALALPKQLSDNMYTYPFLVRCSQPGHFNVDLGIISSLSINRGGNDETSWTVDTIATEWDVTIEITPLVDNLMITSTSNPLLFVKNEMLLDYLGNLCGFDLYANNLGTKIDLMMAFVLNKFTGIPHAIENKISDTLYNKLNPLFRLSS